MGWISDWEGSSRDIGLLAIEFVISNFLASCCLLNGCGCEVQPDALQARSGQPRNKPLQIPVNCHCKPLRVPGMTAGWRGLEMLPHHSSLGSINFQDSRNTISKRAATDRSTHRNQVT